MDRDARRMRGERPFVFSNLKEGIGLDDIVVVRREPGPAAVALRTSSRDALALGTARPPEASRNQVRLRDFPMRLLYGAHRWRTAVRSCVLPVSDAVGRNVVTIEGLARDGLHRVQKAWIEHQVPQCGYCQTGMMMAAVALLAKHPQPTDAQIDAAMTNLCRCGTYARVRTAIHSLASQPVGKTAGHA
jgi:hypothetical protein